MLHQLLLPPAFVGVTDIKGRLGNQLWALARAQAWAANANLPALSTDFGRYRRRFAGTTGLLCSPTPAARVAAFLPRKPERRLGQRMFDQLKASAKATEHQALLPDQLINLDTLTPDAARTTILRGWFFDASTSLARFRPQITQSLSPAPRLMAQARRAVAPFGARALVGLHLRMGDYRQFAGGLFFRQPPDYFDTMRQVEAASRQKPLFVVFCDEPLAAADFPGFDVVIADTLGARDAEPTLALMMQMRIIIATFSTLSMFACYLSGGLLLPISGARAHTLPALLPRIHEWLDPHARPALEDDPCILSLREYIDHVATHIPKAEAEGQSA